MSPADSGMYSCSASSAKSVDWDTRDASLTSIDPAIAAQDSPGRAEKVEEEEEESNSTEGTLEGEEDEEKSSDDVELIRVGCHNDDSVV